MSKLGKIFLYIAVAGAAVAVVFGWLVIGKYNDTKANLAQTETAKEQSDREAAKQKAAAEAADLAKTDAETKLTAANTQISDLNDKVTAAQKDADDAKGALQKATDDAKKAADALAAIQSALGGKSPDEIVAAANKAAADLQTAESEKKILEDSVQSLTKNVADLKDAINRKVNGDMPPGISGQVTFVNRTWNFVVLNVGLSNGVVPNGELIVFRKNAFLGKVKVTSVEANSCVADILPNLKDNIQVGDYVLN